MKVHHNTAKRAARLGIELVDEGDTIVARKDGRELARGPNATKVLIEAEQQLTGPKPARATRKSGKSRKSSVEADDADDFDGEGDEDEPKESASVVKPKYRKKYRPHKDTCGDSLTRRIRDEFTETIDGSDEPEFNWARFVRFAKANECWIGAYASLNNGMKRMNVRNRLAKLIRNKVEINWNVK